MTSPIPSACPSGVATWLVDLFASGDQAEVIVGDLQEEFAGIAEKSGLAVARGWYWRQTKSVITKSAIQGFCSAPWLIVCAVVGGYLVGGAGYFLTEKGITQVLEHYHVYAHINAYLFWLLYGILIERLMQPLFIGCMVAAIAKGR